ncbi:MAG: ATP-binding protein [Desulfuromonadales bacterium]
MATKDKPDRQSLHRNTTARTVIFYIVIASLWIYCSDAILSWFFSNPDQLTRAQTIKGWLFVSVTAALLYFYLHHSLQGLRTREERLEEERDRARRETQERLRQLNTLFDSMSAIVYVADIETNELLYVNQFAMDYFGPDWQGRKCYHYLQQDIDRPCAFCTNAQLVKHGEPGDPVSWEFLNTRNGRWYECFDKAIYWTDGRLVRLEVALDITERRELENVKDDLLSSMSHEMRTPLTAISGYAELLMNETDLQENHRRHVQIICNEADKLTDLVNSFLEVRRLKTNRARINYEFLDFRSLLDEAMKSCRDCKEHHEFRIECQPGLQVYGNRHELTQVMTQLLANACRYSPKGGIISIVASSTGLATSISVSDPGIGIPQHEQETIFKPFYRLDTGDSRSTGGVGLGLSLAREIILLHGGQIKLDSVPGRGSTFSILLPLPADDGPAGNNPSPVPRES